MSSNYLTTVCQPMHGREMPSCDTQLKGTIVVELILMHRNHGALSTSKYVDEFFAILFACEIVKFRFEILRLIACHGRNYSQLYFYKRNQSCKYLQPIFRLSSYCENCL